MNFEIEKALIDTFVVENKRERIIELLSNPKRRSKILDSLNHFSDFDSRYTILIPSAEQNVSAIFESLSSRGALDECYLVSGNKEIDGTMMPLTQALDSVVASSIGTILSCVTGKLAYYEGENPKDRFILERLEV